MATLEKELYENRSYRRTRSGYEATRSYLVSGATNEQNAITASGIPAWNAVYGAGYPSANMRVHSIDAVPVAESVGWFQVNVSWQWELKQLSGTSTDDIVDGTEFWEINGTGETVHVDTCLSQVYYPATAEDPELSVGIDADGNVNGADIFETVLTISVQLWKTTADINSAYLAGVVGSLQKVNSATWYGLNAGECLFNRFRVAKSFETLTEINFEFLGRRNLASGDIPDFLDKDGASISVTVGKDGWQYLWTRPMKKVDESGSGSDAQEKFYSGLVGVADFYEESNFSALDLSGSL